MIEEATARYGWMRSFLSGLMAGRALLSYAAFGLGLIALTFFLDWFEPLFGLALLAPYLVLVVAAARWGGFGAAIFTCLAALPVADYVLFEPAGRFNLHSRHMLELGLVLLAGLWLGWVMDRLRVARERAETAAAAERVAQQERDALLSVIAHDLRNPLTSVRARVQLAELLLRRERPDLEQALRSLKMAVPQVDRVSRLLDDLVTAGRSRGAPLSVNLTEVDLAPLVERVVERWQGEAASHRFEVEVEGPLPIQGDSGRLEQVLDNLLGNAVKYSPAGSTILVTATRRGAEVELSVADQGSGIAPDERPKVFDRFYRQPEHRQSSQPGLGLGLYITRQLVDAHGGRVWVDSHDGQGSRFTVALPARAAEPAIPRTA